MIVDDALINIVNICLTAAVVLWMGNPGSMTACNRVQYARCQCRAVKTQRPNATAVQRCPVTCWLTGTGQPAGPPADHFSTCDLAPRGRKNKSLLQRALCERQGNYAVKSCSCAHLALSCCPLACVSQWYNVVFIFALWQRLSFLASPLCHAPPRCIGPASCSMLSHLPRAGRNTDPICLPKIKR